VLQRPGHWAALGRRWQSEEVDLAVDLTADARASRLLAAMRPRQAVGFLRGNLRLRVQAGIPKACGDEHVARHMLRLVGLTGAVDEPRLEFHPSEAAMAEARGWAAQDARPPVALHPGCNSALRRWKLERFAELTRRLSAEGARVWVLGTRAERDLGKELSRAGAEDCTGRLRLDATAARLKLSRVLVANDSGPMHLGVAVGTPTLALFGPSLPHTAAPLGPPHRHFHVRLPCCPCDQRRCVRPGDFCLDRIEVQTVLEAALGILRGEADRS
jgi:ADP-heptose:LPS heptosyltransferase